MYFHKYREKKNKEKRTGKIIPTEKIPMKKEQKYIEICLNMFFFY